MHKCISQSRDRQSLIEMQMQMERERERETHKYTFLVSRVRADIIQHHNTDAEHFAKLAIL